MVGSHQFFRTAIDAFRNEELQVIISTTAKFSWDGFGAIPSHIHLQQWVPGREIINLADLVIFHGGYGTMMETIEGGEPSIVIPFHTEQESNGRRLEALGCSVVCKLSEAKAQLIRHKWKYGEFTTFIQTDYDLTSAKLIGLVKHILSAPRFTENAKRLQSECAKYRGPEQLFEIINRVL